MSYFDPEWNETISMNLFLDVADKFESSVDVFGGGKSTACLDLEITPKMLNAGEISDKLPGGDKTSILTDARKCFQSINSKSVAPRGSSKHPISGIVNFHRVAENTDDFRAVWLECKTTAWNPNKCPP
jgi:hypothetical protein